MTGKLNLDPALVAQARELARLAGQPVTDLARTHTTVSVERAVLRLAGLDGADEDGMPWVNRLADAVRESVGLEHGVALPAWDAMLTGGYSDLRTLAVDAGSGLVKFRLPMGADADAARESAARSVQEGIALIDERRAERDRMIAATSDPPMPWIYLIVATGDIYEDIPQAQAAAREGADVIAVIRSTGQSLLDYVPEGATREGYAGTYATRENFRLMRGALDDVSRELGRYVRLTNYASGLCMPEIASLAGLERLDMMLNDCMYGIIFRDINPVRTFIDQRFSRQVHARAGIVINTGEDNYLTTADAVDAAHTVVVSQLLNEYFGREAGLADGQLGLGHAFEINPEVPDSFLLELAHAQLVRELFPDAPLKYMPPTKHMTGNVFAGYLLDAFFNLAGVMTDQSILLIGMMTEGIHTPFLSDRDLALENVRYVRRAAGRLGESFRPEPDGFVAQRARQVLGEAIDLLRRIGSQGLLTAIGEGTFGVTRRPADGGKEPGSDPRSPAHAQLRAGAGAKSISSSRKSGKARAGPSSARPRRSAARAIVASTASRIRSGSCLGCSMTERRTPATFGFPLGRKLSSAAGGRLRCAGSTMTRHAVNGRPWAAAIRAAKWDSMSTTIAPVRS